MLKVLDRCYDHFPFLFEKAVFVNLITRQTFLFGNEIDRTDTFKKMILLDLDNTKS